MKKKTTIVALDFDGTITTKDTFLEFIKFSKESMRFYIGFLLFSPLLVGMKLKLYPNRKAKQRIFSHFFKGTNIRDFNRLCEDFCRISQSLLRPQAIERINRHIENGDTLLIISASIENWVAPFARQLNIPVILCTQLEIDANDCLTGQFSTENCYGQEKVNRLLSIFPDRDAYELIACGDSRGDKELMAFADKRWYNWKFLEKIK